MQVHFAGARAAQKLYCIGEAVVGGCCVTKDPVRLDEDMAHRVMSQYEATESPQHGQRHL